MNLLSPLDLDELGPALASGSSDAREALHLAYRLAKPLLRGAYRPTLGWPEGDPLLTLCDAMVAERTASREARPLIPRRRAA